MKAGISKASLFRMLPIIKDPKRTVLVGISSNFISHILQKVKYERINNKLKVAAELGILVFFKPEPLFAMPANLIAIAKDLPLNLYHTSPVDFNFGHGFGIISNIIIFVIMSGLFAKESSNENQEPQQPISQRKIVNDIRMLASELTEEWKKNRDNPKLDTPKIQALIEKIEQINPAEIIPDRRLAESIFNILNWLIFRNIEELKQAAEQKLPKLRKARVEQEERRQGGHNSLITLVIGLLGVMSIAAYGPWQLVVIALGNVVLGYLVWKFARARLLKKGESFHDWLARMNMMLKHREKPIQSFEKNLGKELISQRIVGHQI